MRNAQMRDALRRLDLNLLVTLDALLHHRSVTLAAEHLNVTQSAISHSLAKLRAFFGDPLFVRSGKGILPTSRAEEIGGSIATILAMVRDKVLVEAAFEPAEARREITLNLNDLAEFITLPVVAVAIRRVAPNCTIRVVNLDGAELEMALEDGSVDLSISGPMDMSGEVFQQLLYTTRLAVIGSAAHAWHEPMTLETFATMPQVVTLPARNDRMPANEILSRMGVAPHAVITTAHAMAVPATLVANPGWIAAIPVLLERMLPAGNGIRELETDFVFPDFPVLQYWHRRYQHDQFSRWLRGYMRDELAEAYRAYQL